MAGECSRLLYYTYSLLAVLVLQKFVYLMLCYWCVISLQFLIQIEVVVEFCQLTAISLSVQTCYFTGFI